MPFRFIYDRAVVRFWKHVQKSEGCWTWTGAKTPLGYGNVGFNGRYWRAPRLSWLLHYGTEPMQHILHKCDNPSCVRPEHLFQGSDQDNVDDMVRKGRQRKDFTAIGRIQRNAKGRFARGI